MITSIISILNLMTGYCTCIAKKYYQTYEALREGALLFAKHCIFQPENQAMFIQIQRPCINCLGRATSVQTSNMLIIVASFKTTLMIWNGFLLLDLPPQTTLDPLSRASMNIVCAI